MSTPILIATILLGLPFAASAQSAELVVKSYGLNGGTIFFQKLGKMQKLEVKENTSSPASFRIVSDSGTCRLNEVSIKHTTYSEIYDSILSALQNKNLKRITCIHAGYPLITAGERKTHFTVEALTNGDSFEIEMDDGTITSIPIPSINP